MRMDDNSSLSVSSDVPSNDAPSGPGPVLVRKKPRLRFTSNVVGSLFILTDVICFFISAPITLAAYSIVRGARLAVPERDELHASEAT